MNYNLEELSIELSNKCAMRCIHCSSGSSPEALENELLPAEIEKLITDARDLGASVLSLSGGDPILINKRNLLSYIGLALKIGYSRVLLYTTGISKILEGDSGNTYIKYGITDDLIESICAVPEATDKLTFIFSLHSHRYEVNDYIMGVSGAAQAIVSGIHTVKDYGFRVEVHMVPMLPNYTHTLEMLKLCEKLGVDKLSLLRFVPQTRGADNNEKLGLDVEQFTTLQYHIDRLFIATTTRSDAIYPTRVRAGCPMDFRHTICSDINAKIHPCHAGKDLILVRPRGDVHPCAAWKSLPETDNVRNKSLKDIWENGRVFTALRSYHETDWQDIKGHCSNCRYQPSCKSGCPAQRMHALKLLGLRPESAIDDLYIDAADPLCPAAHTIVRLYNGIPTRLG